MWRNWKEPLYVANGNVKWCNYFEIQFGNFSKISYRVTTWATHPTPSHTPKRAENTHPDRNLYSDVHSSAVRRGTRRRQAKRLSADGRTDKTWTMHIAEHYLEESSTIMPQYRRALTTDAGGCPGGSVLQKSPASVGDTGLIRDPGGSHMPQGSDAGALQLLSVCSGAWELRQENESRSVVSDSLRPHGLYSPWNSPGQNTGVGSCSLLQGISPTQASNPGLP